MKKKEPLMFECIIEYQGYLWFTEFLHNSLYRMKKDGEEAEFVGMFPEDIYAKRMFVQIKGYKDCLIFVPLSATSIVIYDIKKSQFISLHINEPESNINDKLKYNRHMNFRTCEIVGECAYFFPITYPAIIKVNLETYKMDYLYNPISQIEVKNEKQIYFRSSVVKENNIVLWCVCANSLLEFNLNNETFKVKYQENSSEAYTDAIVDSDYVWLLPYSTKYTVRRIDINNLGKKDIAIQKDLLCGNYQFISGMVINNKLWLFPATANSAFIVDCNTLEISKLNSINSKINFNSEYYYENSWKFFFAYMNDNIIYLYNYYSCSMLKYNLLTEQIDELSIVLDAASLEKKKESMIDACMKEWDLGRVVIEGPRFQLNDYIDCLLRIKEKK